MTRHRKAQRLAAAVVAAVAPPLAAAQPPDDPGLERAMETLVSVSAQFDCELELIGGLRTDVVLGRRYVAYSATGTACDAASGALAEGGAQIDVQFLRRPSLAQLRSLVGTMIRAVATTTGCRIVLRATPTLNEATSRWFVAYVTTGNDCEGVQYALQDQSRDFDISFVGGPVR